MAAPRWTAVLLPCPYCEGRPSHEQALIRGTLTATLTGKRSADGKNALATVDVEIDAEHLKLHILEEHS